MKSTRDYSEQIYKLKQAIHAADAVVIGAGAGLSESGGLSYAGERFQKNFADFIAKYHFRDMYSATFYPYSSLEDYWGYGNVRVPAMTYDNKEIVMRMTAEQSDLRIPTELIPHCPKCGEPMSMNLRCDNTFVQDEGWHKASNQYKEFIRRNGGGKILYFELGVGNNTPVIIKYPFWQLTAANKDATYACINLEYANCPNEIENQSICIGEDIGKVMDSLTEGSI